MKAKVHIGMRKVKSLLAVTLAFVIWELIRIFFPMLETHPVFAYIYAIIEMRESPEKTKNFGTLRIKATFVGLIVGLFFVFLSVFFSSPIENEMLRTAVQFIFILLATLSSICLAELVHCKNFCGIAAIIAVICMVSHNENDIYFYAIMRVVQTLIGILSAMVINLFVNCKKEKEQETNQ